VNSSSSLRVTSWASLSVDGQAQEIAQLHDHLLGGGGILAHQDRDRVQGVEQEMGLQLGLEPLELGVLQSPFGIDVEPGVLPSE
jgi:hypothetical protein